MGNNQRNRQHAHSSGPVEGYWEFKPASYQTGFAYNILVKLRAVGFAISSILFISSLAVAVFREKASAITFIANWQFVAIGLLAGAAIIALISWLSLHKPIESRRAGNFFVGVRLYGYDVASYGVIQMKTKWSGDSPPRPDGDDDHPISSAGEVAALHNVLPRLCNLQNDSLYGRGMLEAKKINGDAANGWEFRFLHDPIAAVRIKIINSVLIGVSLGLFGFLYLLSFEFLPFNLVGASSPIPMWLVYFAAPALLAWGILRSRKFSLCQKIYLKIAPRTGVAAHVVDLYWSEHCYYHITHRHWCVLGNAQGVTKFCEKVVQLQDVIEHGDFTHGALASMSDQESERGMLNSIFTHFSKRMRSKSVAFRLEHVSQ